MSCPVEAAASKFYTSLKEQNHQVLEQHVLTEDGSVSIHHRAPDGREWFSIINVDVKKSDIQDVLSLPILNSDEVTITESESEK